jgi:hypothetical protein
LRNDAIVEPLHGPAPGSAAVRAATSAPCYNFTGLGGLIPDPTGGSGVDGPARTIRSGQCVRRRRRRSCLSVENARNGNEKGDEKGEGAHEAMISEVDLSTSVGEQLGYREGFQRTPTYHAIVILSFRGEHLCVLVPTRSRHARSSR